MSNYCESYLVEGEFDRIIFKNIGIETVYVAHGKVSVMRRFKEADRGCFIVDGNEEGFSGIAYRLETSGVKGVKDPPVISVGSKRLIVVGDPDEDFKGSIETLLLKALNERDERVNDLLKGLSLTKSRRDKVELLLLTFLKTADDEVFFSVERFASKVVELVGRDKIRETLRALKVICTD